MRLKIKADNKVLSEFYQKLKDNNALFKDFLNDPIRVLNENGIEIPDFEFPKNDRGNIMSRNLD